MISGFQGGVFEGGGLTLHGVSTWKDMVDGHSWKENPALWFDLVCYLSPGALTYLVVMDW